MGGWLDRLLIGQLNLVCLERQYKICTERHPIATARATTTKRATVNVMYWLFLISFANFTMIHSKSMITIMFWRPCVRLSIWPSLMALYRHPKHHLERKSLWVTNPCSMCYTVRRQNSGLNRIYVCIYIFAKYVQRTWTKVYRFSTAPIFYVYKLD